MKKLLLIIATVAVGFTANAASYTWSTTGRLYKGDGDATVTGDYVTGTAYLMFASVISTSDLISSFQLSAATAQNTVSAKNIASATITSGQISSTATYASTTEDTAYFVIFNGDKMYVSNTAGAGYDALNPAEVQAIQFGAQTSLSKATVTSGAGWYSAAAVPEPTSGLLLLLGVAGLVLRRRRA